MRCIATTLLLLAGTSAYAQTFEVASIKATAPQEAGRIMVKMGGDPGRLDYVNVSLRDLVRQAYGVKDYQVVAPDWMLSARFDVQAKYPPDTPKETQNIMLQALLAERFALKMHKENKELPVYNLIVGKNGPKLKKAEDSPMTAMSDGPGPGAPGNINVTAGARGGGASGGASGGTFRVGGPGGPGGPPMGGRGMTMMRMEGPGKMHITSKGTTVAALSDMLARQVGKPVFDQTGITGNYDVELEFKPEEGGAGGMMRGMPMMAPRPDGGPAPDAVEAPSIFTAIQDQLGLKLEAKKGPVETIVVDSANKTPSEN